MEWKWNKIIFWEQACLNAGLLNNNWKESGIEIFRFNTEVFSENSKK